MGIDYDVKLIVGWEIEYYLVVDYLTQHEIGTCDGWYLKDEDGFVEIVGEDPKLDENIKKQKLSNGSQCFCGIGSSCWKEGILPPGVFVVKASPGFDYDQEDCRYFVSLTNGDSDSRNLDSFDKFSEELIKKAEELAIELGKSQEKPTVFAVPHVH